MAGPSIITQTQSEEFHDDGAFVVACEVKNTTGNHKLASPKVPVKRPNGDSLYGVAKYVPNKMLVSARKTMGSEKTSIECVIGQMQLFKETMEEARQKRQRESNEDHELAVAEWGAIFPQPNWNAVLDKKKRRITKSIVYVEDKKKQIIQEKLNELAAGYYEYDK